MEYGTLKRDAGMMRAQEVARAFDECKTCTTSTAIHRAYTAMLLPHSVLMLIPKISNTEDVAL